VLKIRLGVVGKVMNAYMFAGCLVSRNIDNFLKKYLFGLCFIGQFFRYSSF
jgi:hypothetical protein